MAADTQPLNSRSDADSPDQIGSISTTPSGAATPRPDPTDKRLPGILHSYFGQVRATAFTTPSFQEFASLPPPQQHMQIMQDAGHLAGLALGGLPTAPVSPSEEKVAADIQAPLPVWVVTHQRSSTAAHENLAPAYPTPPASSPSPSTRKGSEGGCGAVAHVGRVNRLSGSSPAFARLQAGNAVTPVGTRRHTADFNPLSNITTSSSVHAAHISNPVNSLASSGSRPSTVDAPAVSAFSSLTSHLEMAKLTDGVALPRTKNTPPLTPRALSNDGPESAKRTPPNDQHSDKANTNGPNTSHASRSAPPVGPPKGKLHVTVSGARGLRPSYDPYAVCVFEWIESIAHEHKQGAVVSDKDGRSREHSVGGVPIQRSGSGMGRSMAIPMKSRQSSTTSLSEQKDFKNAKQVTDPQWNHEAVLCVEGVPSHVVLMLTEPIVMCWGKIPTLTSMSMIVQTMKNFSGTSQ